MVDRIERTDRIVGDLYEVTVCLCGRLYRKEIRAEPRY
ncbi:hypothetical protein MPNT_120062 [Candidatus Methylacidithermus pantelleriae]|uniref:Uncharacterized protein n=1 Tax=Candidatus Methylacidithermus pantelleriae TaxID=2744239 RepID=A0A8J2BGV2_9BACT|nr:hypothetical protein MPNT_120062 [Candidatus Methylacidithermus pantelleriae]